MKFRKYFWATGEPWNSLRTWAVPRFFRVLHCAVMCTLRFSTTGAARGIGYITAPPGSSGVLFVTWHDTTLALLHLFRHRDVGILTSVSRAGRMQAAFWRLYGWPAVYGSTKKREGVKALREIIRQLRAGRSFAFTPDGPTGPRHHAYPGVIYMASRAPTVIMPVGIAASSCWRLPTWDRYMIPKPFARVHVHIGPELVVPPSLNDEAIEDWRRRLESAQNAAQATAAAELVKRAAGQQAVQA